MLGLHFEKVTVRTNERDVSYFVLNFGGVFYEEPGTTPEPHIGHKNLGKPLLRRSNVYFYHIVKSGESGYRSRCLSNANRALYHLS